MVTRSLLLVAGPSGSGKSRLARLGGAASISLDEFYHDHDHPDLPRSSLGIPDWDDVRTWDLPLAVETLRRLLREGVADVPVYDISKSARVGTRTHDCRDAKVLLAEGIFAPQAYVAAQVAGLPARAVWLDRPRVNNFSRRLSRDLREHRKPPMTLVRRGIALFKDEPTLKRAALESGFEPLSMRRALRVVEGAAR